MVEPQGLIQYGNPGDVITWSISASSEVKLSRFIVKITPENDFETTYKDTGLYSKEFTFLLQYKIPQGYAGKLLYFNFTVIDEDGNSSIGLKELQVGDQLLSEYTGLQFRTISNLSNNAFDIEALAQTSAMDDSTMRDIEEVRDTTISPDEFSYKWFSPAGGKFVKANTYNYGEATLLTAKAIYDGSVPQSITDSIAPQDIFITRLGSTASEKYAVIKVVSINNNPSNINDTYTFNIKK